MLLGVHIAAGALALIVGFVALFARKGAAVHRNTGLVFVGAMTVMGSTGAAVAVQRSESANVFAGLFAAYLVITGLTAVRAFPGSRWVNVGAFGVAVAMGMTTVTTALDTLARGKFALNGVPVPMMFFMGTIALIAAVSDVRIIRGAVLRGKPRLMRHLWRMCFALWVAAGSFFLGQADEFPEALRIWPLLSIPVALPLLAILFWAWRMRGPRLRRARAAGVVIPERA